ncbi:phosphate system positive regulatory protein pho81 [Malassezia sp. CBS 17886]|nr:phosphate system positive regulatory protein pho81 [Malassezia sp. CBS 17886]
MKFGKQILSRQISGWGGYYLDYKFLKKIINSLEKGRLADAALFATSVRPADDAPQPPLLAAAESPASELQVHKAAFFFKLERELEKINAFYLQKESELRARLTTLISKKRHLIALAARTDAAGNPKLGATGLSSRTSPSLVALLEGFRYFEKDLAKLQQFIDINATGFRKILKKWDKRSKSQTKELYLARQVDAQPCFNRAFIGEMSDIAAASRLQLESLAEGNILPTASYKGEAAILKSSLPYAATNLPGGMFLHDGGMAGDGLVFDSERPLDFAAAGRERPGALAELGERLGATVHEGRVAEALQVLADARREMAQDAEGADPDAPGGGGLTHMVWRALVAAPDTALLQAVAAGLPDYAFEDDINARTALHMSAIAGKLLLVRACIEHGVPLRQRDVYGREALAYAAMHGHGAMCAYLLSLPAARNAGDAMVDNVDLDGFSPLLHAIVHRHTDTVRILLAYTAAIGAVPRSKADASDLAPLAVAAQSGHVEITRLLLAHGAKVEPNTEGLLPQALAARAGHTECLRLLIGAGVAVNAVEKGTLWTPLFNAAEFGHFACVQLLLDAGASLQHTDEKGRDAVFYAAWNGWVACAQHMMRRAGAPAEARTGGRSPDRGALSAAEAAREMDADGIPSLHLPPPIIPFRTYGHNYLDKRSLVCLSLSNRSIVLHGQPLPDRADMFPGLASSFKLVLTPRSAEGSAPAGIPHTMVLPMAEERDEVTFQVADPEQFYVEWELFRTFGSSRIAKGAVVPGALNAVANRETMQLPLFDWHLSVVGHVLFGVECVRPFGSVQLQIGGRVETYWKSTLPGSSAGGAAGSGAGGSGMLSPAPLPALPADAAPPADAAYVTASSLSGTYLRVHVQFTRDLVPVVCAAPTLPLDICEPAVAHVSAAQFHEIARRAGRAWSVSAADAARFSVAQWHDALASSLVSLQTLLECVPPRIGLALEVVVAAATPQLPLNACIDAALHAVYGAADRDSGASRSLFFSSACASACVALNWKQPNCASRAAPLTPDAVFFICQSTLDARMRAGTAGADGAAEAAGFAAAAAADMRQTSVAEAVRFAKGNNLLGVVVDAALLEMVPDLIPSVKAAGLVLIALGRPSAAALSGAPRPTGVFGSPALPYGDAIDGYIDGNVVECGGGQPDGGEDGSVGEERTSDASPPFPSRAQDAARGLPSDTEVARERMGQ